MHKIFLEIWDEREHVSELSGTPLHPIGHWQWHWQFLHLLGQQVYPNAAFDKENIILGTPIEHEDQEFIKEFRDKRDKLKAKYNKT